MTYHKLAQIQMATMSIQINWKCTDTTVHLNNWQQGKNTSKGHVQNRRNPHKSQRESLCVVSIRCENLRFTEKRAAKKLKRYHHTNPAPYYPCTTKNKSRSETHL